MSTFLIFGSDDDPFVQSLQAASRRHGAQPLVLSESELRQHLGLSLDLDSQNCRGSLTIASQTISLAQLAGLIIRRTPMH